MAEEVKGLDQPARATLRKYGVRFGAYHIYLAGAAQAGAACARDAIVGDQARRPGGKGSQRLAASRGQWAHVDSRRQRYSESTLPHCRLSHLRRARSARRYSGDGSPISSDRRCPGAKVRPGPKPDGVFDGRSFLVTGAMTSLTGASGEDFASILRSLGYRMDRKPKPAETATPTTCLTDATCCVQPMSWQEW